MKVIQQFDLGNKFGDRQWEKRNQLDESPLTYQALKKKYCILHIRTNDILIQRKWLGWYKEVPKASLYYYDKQ